jgi:hypothetical protein
MTASEPGEGPSRWFWVTVPIGLVFIGIGVHGLYQQRSATSPGELARWFFGAGVVHDALLAPVFVLVGFATTRLPSAARTPVRIALAASVLLVAFSWPLVQGWGRRASNPSALPLDYGRNLMVSLLVVGVITAVTIAVRAYRR